MLDIKPQPFGRCAETRCPGRCPYRDPELMTAEERCMLNDYHRKVYEALSPLLSKEEREWLSVYTRPV